MNAQFVSVVSGVNLAADIDPELKLRLNDLLSACGVVVVKNQQLTPPLFMRAIEQFGELLPQQIKKFTLPDYPLVGYNSSNDLPLKNGKMQVRGENYHTDHSNESAPPRATALFAVQIPSRGGDTQFVDVRAAYDDLPEAIKGDIDGLFSLHVHQSSKSPRELAKLTAEQLALIPQTLQPLAITHPTSGRAALYLNTGRMEGIQGMPEAQAYELIDYLYNHAIHPRYEYRHQWQAGDLVIWDNQAVMHQANADYDPTEYRYLLRLMVKGVALKPYRVKAVH
jgi:taurine dioxygenase